MRAIFYNPTLIGTVYQTIPECLINTPEQYKIRIMHTKWVKTPIKMSVPQTTARKGESLLSEYC